MTSLSASERERQRITKAAITALKQRFSGMTTSQRAKVKEAANAFTESEFGQMVWTALSQSTPPTSRQPF